MESKLPWQTISQIFKIAEPNDFYYNFGPDWLVVPPAEARRLAALDEMVKKFEEAGTLLKEYFKHVRQDILYPPDQDMVEKAMLLIRQAMEDHK